MTVTWFLKLLHLDQCNSVFNVLRAWRKKWSLSAITFFSLFDNQGVFLPWTLFSVWGTWLSATCKKLALKFNHALLTSWHSLRLPTRQMTRQHNTCCSFCILSFLVGTFRFFNALFFKSNFDLKILFLLHYRQADRDGLQWRCPQDRKLLPMFGGVSYKKGEKCNMYSLLQFIFIFLKSHPLWCIFDC